MQPSELYIPDGLCDTLATRTTTRYGHLHNGHEASVVKIELFMPYFDTDRYVTDHHNGDVYLWGRESNNIKLLALQVGTTPLSVDTVKMLTQTTANVHQLTMQNRSQSHSSSRSSLTASRASARTNSCNSCYRTPHDPCWINAEDLTLENTLHNISINPSTIDGPADKAIFESNHLAEIVDIWSKLIQNLVKVGETYCHLHAQLLNPSPEELENFLVNCEKDFDSHLHHILHLDDLLARDARHHIQLRYHVINYPRYIPTIDKLKADLAYFKDDFWNKDMFEVIHKPTSNKSHPRTGHRASMPKPLDIPSGSPGTTILRGNPPLVTPVPPWEPLQPHLQGKHLFHHQGQPPLVHQTMHLCLHHNQYPNQEQLHHPKISLNHSHNLNLSLLQYQNLMVGGHDEPLCQTHPQVTIQCQTTELSLSMDILQAKKRVKPKSQANPLCVSDVAETTIQNITAKTAKFPADTAKVRCMPHIAVHSFQEPHQPQMVTHLTLLALMDEASKLTHQVCPASRRSPRTRRGRKRTYPETPGPAKWHWCSHSTTPGKQKYTVATTRATTVFLPTAPTTGTPAWSDCGPARPWHCHCTQTDGSITSATLQDKPNSD